MKLPFTKMHGCGNDYIYLDCRGTGLPAEVGQWSVKLSRRRLSVGADGIICICAPETPDADAAMRMYNADGSEGLMCGNGIRCVAQYLYTHGAPKDTLEIDTACGRKTLRRLKEGWWQVEMGRFSAMAADLPAKGLGPGPLVNVPLTVFGAPFTVTCVSMGNPHCVVLWDKTTEPLPTGAPLAAIGPGFEKNSAFPERTNTEFVTVQDPTHITMRVWERGSGETLACGTGACASVSAMVLQGLCPRGEPVTVSLLGGELTVTVREDDSVLLAGPAETAYEGTTEV